MTMDLYFSPMACSLASRISLYETGAQDVQFVEIDPKTKRTMAGANYFDIYSLGLVPYLRLEDGSALSENAAILQYIASRYPDSELAPRNESERAQLQQWLCFIGTELHKGMFIPLFDQKAPEGTRQHTLNKYASRLKYLNDHLAGRRFLLDRFTVADAYLYTILNWTGADASRSDALPGAQELPRVAADTAQHRQGVPGGNGALQRGTGAQ
jgi:glutathione S-transferase